MIGETILHYKILEKLGEGGIPTAKERDPTYALAYAGIADCYGLLPIYKRSF